MQRTFEIGDFRFRLTWPENLQIPGNFMKFAGNYTGEMYEYTIHLSNTLPEPKGTLVARRGDIAIYRDGNLESRCLGVKGMDGFYAVYAEENEKTAEITLDESRIRELSIDPIFVSLFAMERHLLGRNALILHCAYIVHDGQAILFSAPSGTGKSTQAELWRQYRDARVINGDKSLVQRIDGQWTARGWPVCGTSEICHNEEYPIRAIVMLSQAPENHAESLRAIAALGQLYAQVTVNSWDKGYVMQAMDLLENLTSRVPVYHLGCTISEEAVETLEKTINT